MAAWMAGGVVAARGPDGHRHRHGGDGHAAAPVARVREVHDPIALLVERLVDQLAAGVVVDPLADRPGAEQLRARAGGRRRCGRSVGDPGGAIDTTGRGAVDGAPPDTARRGPAGPGRRPVLPPEVPP